MDESANTVSRVENTPAYTEEVVKTEAVKNDTDSKASEKQDQKKTEKKDKTKKTKEKSKKKGEEKSSKTKKGKRVFELNDIDFDGISEDDKKKILTETNKSDKNIPKRKIITGNDFDILDEELEKIHEIQKQIKANKSAQIQLTKEEEHEIVRNRLNLIVRIVVLVTLISIIIFALLVIRHNGIIADTKRIEISQTDGISNSSNFIYLDVPLQFEDNVVKITKIRLDSQELAIYLEKSVDFSKYEFHIIDDSLNKYYDTTNYNRNLSGGQDVELTFEPLALGTKKFSLKVENIETGYSTETIFELKEPVKYPNVEFYYNVSPVDDNIYVLSTVFSSAYTKTVVVAKGEKEDVEFIEKENVENGNLYLKHKGVSVPLETGETEYAYFEEYDTGIAIIKHAPLSTLVGSVEYGAQNIYRQKTIEEYIDMPSLVLGEDIVDNVYSNTITVEGIFNYDGTIVIPMHGQKVNAIPKNPKVYYEVDEKGRYSAVVEEDPKAEEFDKVAVKLDATLYCKDDDGNEFTVESDSRVGDGGTDVIFSDKRLKGKNLSDVQILIHSFVTIEDGISKTINLENTQRVEKTNDVEFEKVVRDSFLSRLKYKSRELTASYVTGFDNNMETNFSFEDVYKPIETSTSAYYSTFIEGFASQDNVYYAIVCEEWTARDKNNEIVKMSNKHKIIAEKQGRNYIIIYDKIIEE